MTAYVDTFRKILLQPDGVTLTADAVNDTLTITGGNGVAFNPNDSNDSFEIDVDYSLFVPIGTTELRLNDVNSNFTGIDITAGSNISITRSSDSELVITATVGGSSKAISNATQTSPVVITTSSAHSFSEGTPVTITDVVGMTELNGNEYYADILTSTTFALYNDDELTSPVDGTVFSSYISNGIATGEYFPRTQLSELSDVNPTGAQENDFLTYQSGVWRPAGLVSADVIGSVFADDSTLLVDSVAGKIVGNVETNSLTVGGIGFVNLNNDVQGDTFYGGATTNKSILFLKGADYLAGSDNGGGVTIQGGSARNSGDNGDVIISSGNGGLTGTGTVALIADNVISMTATQISINGEFTNTLNTDIAGSVFADDSTVLVDSVNGIIPWNVVDSTPTTLSGYGITDAATSTQGAKADTAVQPTGATFTGLVTLQQTTEKLNKLTGATGTVVHNLNDGAVFYHDSMSADFTANFTNVPTTDNRTISVVLILSQGGTAYIPTAVQIDGSPQTINWQSAVIPSGNANQVDIVSFTLIKILAAPGWTVIGSLSTYG